MALAVIMAAGQSVHGAFVAPLVPLAGLETAAATGAVNAGAAAATTLGLQGIAAAAWKGINGAFGYFRKPSAGAMTPQEAAREIMATDEFYSPSTVRNAVLEPKVAAQTWAQWAKDGAGKAFSNVKGGISYGITATGEFTAKLVGKVNTKAGNFLQSHSSMTGVATALGGAAVTGLGIYGIVRLYRHYTSNVNQMSYNSLLKLVKSDEYKDQPAVKEVVARLENNMYIHRPYAIQDIRTVLNDIIAVKATVAANDVIVKKAKTDKYKDQDKVKSLLVAYDKAMQDEDIYAATMIAESLAPIVAPSFGQQAKAFYANHTTLCKALAGVTTAVVVGTTIYLGYTGKTIVGKGLNQFGKAVVRHGKNAGAAIKATGVAAVAAAVAHPVAATAVATGVAAATVAGYKAYKHFNPTNITVVLKSGLELPVWVYKGKLYIITPDAMKVKSDADKAELFDIMNTKDYFFCNDLSDEAYDSFVAASEAAKKAPKVQQPVVSAPESAAQQAPVAAAAA